MFDTFSEFPTTTALCCAAATIGVALYDRRGSPDGLGRIFWTWAIVSAAALALLATAWSPACARVPGILGHGRATRIFLAASDAVGAVFAPLALSYLLSPFGVVYLVHVAVTGDFRKRDGARWGPTARAAAVFAANVGAYGVLMSRAFRSLDE